MLIRAQQIIPQKQIQNTMHFLEYSLSYTKNFPLKEFQIKVKDLQAPWINKGLKKSSKQKQKLHIKFLNDKLIQNEKI